MRLAQKFIAKGMPIVGVPRTIDNDPSGTVATFGYDTAVDAVEKLHATAEAHERVMVHRPAVALCYGFEIATKEVDRMLLSG